jgi:hypothetical protein
VLYSGQDIMMSKTLTSRILTQTGIGFVLSKPQLASFCQIAQSVIGFVFANRLTMLQAIDK